MKCSWPTCKDDSTHGEYCFQHNRIYGTRAPKPAPKPIPKKSVKAKQDDKEYKQFKDTFLSAPENKICAIQGPNCTIVATCINHKKRRFKDTKMNPELVEPSCFNCNSDIENHDKEARETGHLLSKFS